MAGQNRKSSGGWITLVLLIVMILGPFVAMGLGMEGGDALGICFVAFLLLCWRVLL